MERALKAPGIDGTGVDYGNETPSDPDVRRVQAMANRIQDSITLLGKVTDDLQSQVGPVTGPSRIHEAPPASPEDSDPVAYSPLADFLAAQNVRLQGVIAALQDTVERIEL